jgi:phage terminase large subunit-like protein
MAATERSAAYEDWRARLIAGDSLIVAPPLFAEEADAALSVFKSLVVVDLPNKPTLGEVCEPWVFDLVAAIFGAYDAASARRMIREVLLLVSKKNGKSTIVAGIAVTALVRNWRHEAELIVLAPTLEIANNCFDPAAGMARETPGLEEILKVVSHQRTIRHLVTHAELKVVAADSDTVGGKKASWVIVDELWLFGKRANAKAMLMEATGGLASRDEGIEIYLTTMSDEAPAGVFKEKLNYFRRVRDGEIDDPASLPVLYEWPEDMLESEAYLDPANWYLTNPNLGQSVSADFIASKLKKAELGEDEESLQLCLAKYLNVEIGLRLRRDRWVGADYWQDAGIAGLTFDDLLARSEVVVAGIDGGGLDDLLGLYLIGREKETGRWLGWGHAWANAAVWKLRPVIATQLDDMVKLGEVTKCATPNEDVEGVADILERVLDAGLFPESAAVGIDQIGAATLPDVLAQRGFTMGELDSQLVSVAQGFKMNGLILGLERKLWDGTFVHGGQQLMAWAVSNARTEMRGNAVLITKQVSGRSKIDPVIAMLNAFAMMVRGPEAVGNAAPEIMVL